MTKASYRNKFRSRLCHPTGVGLKDSSALRGEIHEPVIHCRPQGLANKTMAIKITKKPHDYNYKPAKWRSFLGGIICLSLSIIGFWIAFYGDIENIQGGIPFIAEAANLVIGRIVFGFGAVVTGWLAVVAFRELLNKGEDKN